MSGGMPDSRRGVLHLFQTLIAVDELDAMVKRLWPHDVYRQTVAVMGFDPLPPKPERADD